MGIPIDGPAWLFGDNQSVVTSSTIPQSTLNKRHNALSYHRVRENIAAGVINFMHIAGKTNPSDVLTKYLGWSKFWPLVQPILFWTGETMKAIDATKPITVVIQDLVDNPPSELRGVTDSTKQSEINSTCEVSVGSARKAHGSSGSDKRNPAVLESASNSTQNRSYGNSSADWTLVLKKGKPK
jgi:hypothetical protein